MKLYLSNHPQFVRQWLVKSTTPNWRTKLEGVITRFDSVAPFQWAAFSKRVEELGAEIEWVDDPAPIFKWLESLDADPGVEIASDMEGTYRGFFPFQVQGINFMADQSGLFQWSTGTGKTVGLEGLLLRSMKDEEFDLYLVVVKRGNKTNTQRKLLDQAGIESIILDGDHDKREGLYMDLWDAMEAGEQPVAILNWEKLREDEEAFMILVEGRKVFVAWDEISDKVKNRQSQLWRSITRIFFSSHIARQDRNGNSYNIYYPTGDRSKWRTEYHQFLGMTATPIINSPDDMISIMMLLAPDVLGSVKKAHDLFVAKRHKKYKHVLEWKNLDLLEQMTAHVVHQVDKDDPDIAIHFPKAMEEKVWIDLDPHDRALYDVLADEYKKAGSDTSILSKEDIMAAIGVLEMICSNPRSVLRSAEMREDYEQRRRWSIAGWEEVDVTKQQMKELIAQFDAREKAGSSVALRLRNLIGKDERFTDKHSAKLEMLREDLDKHKGKALVFTKMNDSLVPYLSESLAEKEIEHVVYTGGMTDKQLQAAQDAFKIDPAIRVFLSSDAGSDSIDLEEADLCIHYDLPWTHARLVQRQNRQHRITSAHEHVRVRTYLTPDTVEERFMEIILEKKWYQEATTGGTIKEQSMALRKGDLLYILTGQRFKEE